MATILTKKKDSTGAPLAGDLTNSTGGAELAVNTADKRLYTKNSGGTVVEVGTNPGEAVTFVAGSASTPAITTTGDTNTGIFFPAADTIAFAEGGAEAMRIDSSGNVGIGTTSPTDTLDVAGGITISAANGLDVTGSDSTSSQTPLVFYRGGVGDKTGTACRIRTVGDGANNAVTMIFDTADTERMRIDSSGNVGIGTTSPAVKLDVVGQVRASTGILFGSDTAAANALDDYEEGTWTPVIADASSGGNASVTTPTSATYTKIGNLVNVQCFFTNVSTVGLTAGNDIFIRGFPFTALSVAGTTFVPGSIIVQEVTFSGYLTPYINDNNTFGRIVENTTGAIADFIMVSEFSTGVTDFYMSLTYQAA